MGIEFNPKLTEQAFAGLRATSDPNSNIKGKETQAPAISYIKPKAATVSTQTTPFQLSLEGQKLAVAKQNGSVITDTFGGPSFTGENTPLAPNEAKTLSKAEGGNADGSARGGMNTYYLA